MSDAKDLYGVLENSTLKIGNSLFERSWDLGGITPSVAGILDKRRNRQWCEKAPFSDAFHHPELKLTDQPRISLKTAPDDFLGAAEDHLLVEVLLDYDQVAVRWEHRIWPDLPLISSRYFFCPRTAPLSKNILEEFFDDGKRHVQPTDDRIDFFGLKPTHLAFKSAAFFDHTDSHNNLVVEKAGLVYPKEHHKEQGNFLHLTDLADGGGLLLLKLGPSPVGHLSYPGFDFSISGNTAAIVGSGIGAGDLVAGEWVAAYGSAAGVTDGSKGTGENLCRNFLKRVWRAKPERNFSILSNTWGDRLGESPISEAMIKAELNMAANIGLSHAQIDAGWQKGAFSALAVEARHHRGPYDIDPDFWQIDQQKFPKGFTPIMELAKGKNLRLGLWFTPDLSNDYAQWEKDAKVVTSLCGQYGFDNIKIDGVSVHSKKGEANFLKFLKTLYLADLCVNLDLTAGQRLGYFYGNEFAGNIFLENRYTIEHSYFPHWTLRNIWQLAHYLPTHKFQIEFLNTELNQQHYQDDPFSPQAFGIEYAFAVSMAANSLCWMETSRLSKPAARKLAKLVKIYRPIQKTFLCGTVYPIGEEPSGRSWCGFQSVTGNGEGYLLIFREVNQEKKAVFRLREIEPDIILKVEKIAGCGNFRQLKVNARGEVNIRLARPRSFILLRYSR